MPRSTLIIILASTLIAAIGQFLLKLGSSGKLSLQDLINGYNLGGLACYGLGAGLWMLALTKAPLHAVYPFTILTFILVGVGSIVFLGDRPSPSTYVGWAVVLAGLLIISWNLDRT